MARRKEVFQSKVLQKLYPIPSKSEKAPSPSHSEVPVKMPLMKSNRPTLSDGTVIGDGAIRAGEAHGARRVYTVLPPPAEYKTGAEGLVTHAQPADINTVEDPAVEDTTESKQEEEEDDAAEQPRRRRRRKRNSNAALQPPSVADGKGQANEPMADRSNVRPTPEEGGEQLSKNKRRKLKKRRHKEKLHSLGLVPRAAALVFTYQRKGEEEKEEFEDEDEEEPELKERRLAELCGFLRTTMDTYLSDRLLPADRPPPPPVAVVEGLLSSISSDTAPPSVLKQLHTLQTLVELGEPQRLVNALEELSSSPPMPTDEAAAVVCLFRYWITDILPMQKDTLMAQSAQHLPD